METPAEALTRDEFALARRRFADVSALAAAVSGSGAHLAGWLPWAAGGYTADDAAAYLRLTHGNWETGRAYEYWLAHGFTGRGLITRAAATLIADAFRRGAGYVEIKHDELNTRSGAIPARLGFSPARKETTDPDRAPACTGTALVWRLDRPEKGELAHGDPGRDLP
ncbi:GNAT family N-acetyltransferase [Amycolatopsis sp. NPDC049252]|uniref:GNAT family N-acetyltransferase n=1 Tax=Amycolatopsis sp. NPDC049252 TaxID=3363933 RepID=UPI0037247A0F